MSRRIQAHYINDREGQKTTAVRLENEESFFTFT
jgi:hypothetical protein